MTELLNTDASASQTVQSRFVPLEEAEGDASRVYYGSLTTRTLVSVIVVLCFIGLMGYSAVNARGIARATELRVGGTVVLSICAIGLAYTIYEYRRKQRVFILDDCFAVERRFSFDVELIPWTDVAKLYCLDRTTVTKYYVYFLPVASSKNHRGKLRIVLVDGREIVITKRVRDFSAMANQFVLRTKASQLVTCTKYLIDGGTLDFDKFGLSREGLVHKRKLIQWSDIQRISLNARGTLLFKTTGLWWPPRFNTDTLPNASLLLELIAMFGHEVHEA